MYTKSINLRETEEFLPFRHDAASTQYSGNHSLTFLTAGNMQSKNKLDTLAQIDRLANYPFSRYATRPYPPFLGGKPRVARERQQI
jgi:hypothetical protein